MGLTLVTTSPVAKRIFQRVMESFAAMLCSNTTLRWAHFFRAQRAVASSVRAIKYF